MADPRPHKPKSTGWRGQNNHWHGHLDTIAEQVTLALGYRVTKGEVADRLIAEMVEDGAWPQKMVLGRLVPMDWSEVESAVANAAIEMAHATADLHDFFLWEYTEDGVAMKYKHGAPWRQA